MTMRYGTDEAEEGRRRRGKLGSGEVPARKRAAPKAATRQAVNQPGVTPPRQPVSRPQLSQAVDRFTRNLMDRNAPTPMLREASQIGGKVPSRRQFDDPASFRQRPQATPVPFPQQLVQSGMMNTQPIWDTSSGQGVTAPGYSVNPMHPMWGNPTPPQFPNPGMNPMNYYWGSPRMQNVPRVWTGNEMTPQGFRGIMNQYGANIPWMRQNQMNPFGF